MKRIKTFLNKAGNTAKKAFQVIVGAVVLFFDYVVYALDCVLIAPFPRSTPAFRYWNKEDFEDEEGEPIQHDFKKYSYIRITTIGVITTIVLFLI